MQGGESRDLGAVGAVELPGDADGALDEVLLEVVPGLEALGPAVEAMLEGLGVLAGQDESPGGHAVLDGVEPRPLLALGGPGPGTLLGVAAVDLGAVGLGRRIGRGGRGGHGGMPLVRVIDRRRP